MSFRTQRLANRFPLWTKLRKDPSSFGSRFFDTFAEGLENNSITNKRLLEDLTLTKRNIGRSFLYEVILDTEDQIRIEGSSWIYPEVIGTINSVEYNISKANTITDLIMATPTRLSLVGTLTSTNRLVWDSDNPFVYFAFDYPERLWIKINNSTHYVNKTRSKDIDYSGLSSIIIYGIDYDYHEFQEKIQIDDDGLFITNNVFREVSLIEREGFNGHIEITAGHTNQEYEVDPYRILIMDDLEGPLKYFLTSGETSYLSYKTDRFKLGRQYRKPGIEVLENTEEFVTLALEDVDGEDYTAVSLAINPYNTFLYILDDVGRIHIYDPELPVFSALAVEDTVSSYVEINAVHSYAKYLNTEYLWTRFARIRYPIVWIEIKRIDPDNIITYLQSDKNSWSSSPAQISCSITGKNKVENWKDFRFETLYNKKGLWTYVVTTKTNVDLTVFTTAVQCATLRASATLNTSLSGGELIYFGDDGLITVDFEEVAYQFEEHVDTYLIDERAGKIWLSDNYDDVRITS